ncbi:hypothetical protein X798_05721 [Onchocerca flexuosa]|uniref:Transmembrane protein n=2 Tax=Onchocerca flexuosa TaxID=387005 RepID=A0A183HYD2_9BILA|nr:hypothetical protein X798_05721 [Onchocerca flexuosa]VDP11446.1 unnamed protein product [Onchocerca flexuosa]
MHMGQEEQDVTGSYRLSVPMHRTKSVFIILESMGWMTVTAIMEDETLPLFYLCPVDCHPILHHPSLIILLCVLCTCAVARYYIFPPVSSTYSENCGSVHRSDRYKHPLQPYGIGASTGAFFTLTDEQRRILRFSYFS